MVSPELMHRGFTKDDWIVGIMERATEHSRLFTAFLPRNPSRVSRRHHAGRARGDLCRRRFP